MLMPSRLKRLLASNVPSAALMLLALSVVSLPTPGLMATENWTYTGFTPMFMFGALFHSQGVAYDDQNNTLLWSWQYGLQVTDTNYQALVTVPTAIPSELRLQGSNHIGGIDYLNGVLYAPIEDGDKYQHPYVVLFDAQTLVPTGQQYQLPVELQPDGVPWLAIDEANGVIYSAPWNPVFALNVYDLHTLAFLRQIPLDVTIGRIQGAKVRDGKLYAATDDATMTVYSIDLSDGYVTPLFNLITLPGVFADDPMLETESLTFWDAPDGSSLHVQVIRSVYPNPDNPRKPFRLAPSTCFYHFKLN